MPGVRLQSPPAGGAGRLAGLLRSGIGNAPDRAAGVVGDEQRPVLGDGKRRRPAPYLGAAQAGGPEADHEILVAALWATVLERDPHHLVTGWLRPIPRAPERDEGAAAPLRRELLALVEHEVQQ